jgi:flagellar protein FlaG
MPVMPTSGHPPLAFAGTSPAQQKDPSENLAVRSAVDAISQSGIIAGSRQLSFLVDTATERLVVRVIDTETGEVVSQIPTDQVLQIAATLSGAKQADHIYG